MRCHKFQTTITELLNGRLEESSRREALAHARACRKCAAVLERQKQLNLQLIALAVDQSSEQLPPQAEQRLRSAFRAQSEGRKGSILEPRYAVKHKRWVYAAAMAALILGAAGVHILRHRPAVSQKGVPPQRTEPLNADRPIASTAPVPVRAEPAAKAPGRVAATRQPRSRSPLAHAPAGTDWVTTEVATDFYVLPYVAPFRAEERIRVVRTRVPRSLLSSFGVPVHGDGAFNPIQADVMVGEDNVARAIRFVQQWQLPRTASGPF